MAADNNMLDTDSEDEIPAGWEERVTLDGRVYYANHKTESTQWHHPHTGKRKKVAGELPYGWERNVSETGHVYYVDHVNQKTTFTDPRLAFATEDKGNAVSEIKQRFDGNSSAFQVLLGRDLTGSYAVVTGANCGIGYEIAKAFAHHGANVIIACRNPAKAAKAVVAIRKGRPQAKVEAMELDLASLSSVKEFSDNYKEKKRPLHILILNAGVFSLPHTLTEDGVEQTFQVNYLSNYYLIQCLQEVLVQSSPSRIVLTSSESHRFSDLNWRNMTWSKLSMNEKDYQPIIAYNQSKLCNLLLCSELYMRLSPLGVSCNAVHPGNMVNTYLPRNWWFYRLLYTVVRPFAKSASQGAAVSVFCATARELHGLGGMYFNNCCQCLPSDTAQSDNAAKLLWSLSENMLRKCLRKETVSRVFTC